MRAGAAPSVRVASAGTGKTTSLVLRYLALIDAGTPLRRVAGVTFTRAAAAELGQRVAEAVVSVTERGEYLDGLFVPAGPAARFERARRELEGALLTTIHGFMLAALRLSAPQLGLDPEFATLAEWEADALFEVELNSLLLLARQAEHPLAAAAAYLGHDAVPQALALFRKRSLAQRLTFGTEPRDAALGALYGAALAGYHKRLGAGRLAPSEIERRALAALKVRSARSRLVRRYPLVLVDEYQDVNPRQGEFFAALAEAGAHLELVGDPKQSIYSFRNADVTVFREAVTAAAGAGTLLPALVESRRHSQAVLWFLNRLTRGLAEEGLGFGAAEAPLVAAAGGQADVPGAVELRVVQGDAPLAELRADEAALLAERLQAHHERGVPYDDMAVLARSYAGLVLAGRALTVRGVPNVLVQGRGYYERPEVRDVRHALGVGVDPVGESLAPFLRGPFAALELGEVAEVMRTPPERRLDVLRELHGGVAERIGWLGELAHEAPAVAVERLLREPVVDGRRFPEFHDARARENLDALLFDIVSAPPADVALLLERLELLARRADAGDVPQVGAGVRLLTVHGSKGLEFSLTAVYDTGRGSWSAPDPQLVEPATGRVYLKGSEGYEEAAAAAALRQQQESYRLLYVAASRARDVLVLTGSARASAPAGWLAVLNRLDLAKAAAGAGLDVTVEWRADADAPDRSPPLPQRDAERELAPFLASTWPRATEPPVTSPTRLSLRAEEAAAAGASGPPEYGDEALPAAMLVSAELEVARGQVGRGRARGTLAHYAIGQDWRSSDGAVARTLEAQDVLLPFSPEQRADIVREVLSLLADYEALLGGALPPLAERQVDRAELPLVVRRGELVWEGIVDRLYRVDGEWFVDDYKTDAVVAPERYYLQLGLYLDALTRALGERPVGRLVFLRARRVITPGVSELERAVARALG